MADPPAGGPECPPTNSQETTTGFTEEDFETRTTIENRKRTRSGDAFAPSDPAGRITTKEVWKLIGTLKDVIRHQTATIAATQSELQEIKHNQNVTATRTWAAAAANGGNATPALNHQLPEKDQTCTTKTTTDAFGRYLPTDAVNTHIRTALQSDTTTQDAQVAGIGTTKTGYLIRFKTVESAEMARNNTEWLHKLGNNTKLVKPRFGVVVHRTPTEEFDLETGVTLAAEKIIQDNDLAEYGFHIEELAWMKAKDKALGKFASLGIWFDSAEGAEHMLRNGFVH
ncbi:hypothetical protein PENFLA_c072G10431 [Penicillium flavigenum]|uniref:Uncharacterized protein n=1 Tax=Penicillium flavigenum TaxID=254877 RepID=A0A1V6SBM7_9EURO|nr:hypothetical protein PENFLA_c072G10431 [Penicillium flavigenum]